MLLKLSQCIQRISKGWVVVLLLLLFILTVSVIFPLFSRLLNIPEDVESIDTKLYYTPADLYSILEAYGQQGRQGYAISHITADLIYPIVYAFFFATAISFTFVRVFPRNSRLQMLNLVPFGLASIDLLENITLIILLLSFPSPLTPLAFAAGVITFIKWAAVAVTIAIPLVGLTLWLVRLTRKGIGASELPDRD